MEIICGIDQLSEPHRPSVVSIGSFDGVHRGHQQVIATLIAEARKHQVPSTVITFNPLAKEYFAPHSAVRLQPLEQRLKRLSSLGVEQFLVVEFDQEFASLTPQVFIERVLIDGLGAIFISVGDDFRFGANRTGDFAYLHQQGQQFGFEVRAHDTFEWQGKRVSSGRVREAVLAGDFQLAADLLGEAYQIAGAVSRGEQRGRDIGFPTANIALGDVRFAVQGVFAVRVSVDGFPTMNGVANVGSRPTVGGVENRLEVHLFDFEGNIYDQQMAVEFVAKIRDEKKFSSLAQLQAQIKTDVRAAKLLLNRI